VAHDNNNFSGLHTREPPGTYGIRRIWAFYKICSPVFRFVYGPPAHILPPWKKITFNLGTRPRLGPVKERIEKENTRQEENSKEKLRMRHV
jgi:hypothetical protein